jgi:hypothetical protein
VLHDRPTERYNVGMVEFDTDLEGGRNLGRIVDHKGLGGDRGIPEAARDEQHTSDLVRTITNIALER